MPNPKTTKTATPPIVYSNDPTKNAIMTKIMGLKNGGAYSESTKTSNTGPNQEALDAQLEAVRMSNQAYIEDINRAREMVNAKNYKAAVMQNIALGNDPVNSSFTRQVEAPSNNILDTTDPEGMMGGNVFTIRPEREAPMFDPAKLKVNDVPQTTVTEEEALRIAKNKPGGGGGPTPPVVKAYFKMPGIDAQGNTIYSNPTTEHDMVDATNFTATGKEWNQIGGTAKSAIVGNNIQYTEPMKVNYQGLSTTTKADLPVLMITKAAKEDLKARGVKDPSADNNWYEINGSGIVYNPSLLAKGNYDYGVRYKADYFTPGVDKNGVAYQKLNQTAATALNTVMNHLVTDSFVAKELPNIKKATKTGWLGSGQKFDWDKDNKTAATSLTKGGLLLYLMEHSVKPKYDKQNRPIGWEGGTAPNSFNSDDPSTAKKYADYFNKMGV